MLFNPAESIDFNGNTGPFIQYTYARIRSIVRKAVSEKGLDLNAKCNSVKLDDKERDVIKMLHDMPSVVEQAAEAYSPAMVANFTFELAKAFNSFYQDTPILREPDANRMVFLVQLCDIVSVAIKNMMHILGIDVPERM
jgi:arginyl-tRNA synthetase